jgi:hypothetical protein
MRRVDQNQAGVPRWVGLTDTINRLETKLKDRNEALAELMEEHVRLKKELGEI